MAGVEYTLNPGEGAFYGPKLEFVLRDAIGRDWQCGTLQVDFVLPERLDAEYVGEDGARRTPVMLHRAILGSFERFLGIVIEHYAGRFPLWLAPVQVVVATIVSDADDYAREVAAALRKAGLEGEPTCRTRRSTPRCASTAWRMCRCWRWSAARRRSSGTVALRRLGAPAQEVVPLDEAVRALAREATPPDLRALGDGSTSAHRLNFSAKLGARCVTFRILPTIGQTRRPLSSTTTGATHSQRTNAGAADPRRATSERRDPRAAGAADRPGR